MTNSSSRGQGRPTLLTPQMISDLSKAVQDGKSRAQAADAVGISQTTLQRWINAGRRARGAGVMPLTKRTPEQLALRLVHALEVADLKNRAIEAIMTPAELQPTAPTDYKPIGRPALLTDEVLDKIVPLVAAGKMSEAGRAAGVDRRSVQRWVERGVQVHALGSARTEYERLCGLLYARTRHEQPTVEPDTELAAVEPEKPAAPSGLPAGVIVISPEPRRGFLNALISSRFGLRRLHRA